MMAGAAGRNLGKTEFLCRAIRRQSAFQPVVGIKITTIDDSLAEYRRIDAPFEVSIEEPADDNKDTHRMFRSGASKVFWLRVKRPHLEDGLNALFHAMEKNGVDLTSDCLVMESGGARNFIEPGLFFIIRENSDALKPSCAEVAHFADRLNTVSGNGWEVLPEDMVFENGRWGLKENATAIVLCGGGSTRMGEDKALLQLINGKPLLVSLMDRLKSNFPEVVISGSRERYGFAGAKVVEDAEPNRGPLMGLLCAMRISATELCFAISCDVPDIHLPFVRKMLAAAEGHDAVVPVLADGKKQPLFAIYRKSMVPVIEGLLAEGRLAVHALLDRIDVRYVDLDGDWYRNLNTPHDVEDYEKRRT